jgi:hypothetical protein
MGTLPRKLANAYGLAKRRAYQALIMDKAQERQLLFVFGCQRSGTTMLTGLFRNDLEANIYSERRVATGDDRRVPDLEQLREKIEDDPARLVVCKPIVESHRALEFMDFFGGAKSLWMFRRYSDVARSSTRRFSPNAALRNLRAIAESTAEQTFASENVSPETRSLVARHFHENMGDDDAQSLYWYVRNIIFYEQQLDRHDRCSLCSYESFVSEPDAQLRKIYDFLGRPYPGPRLVRDVHTRSVQSRPLEGLSSELAELCDELQERLESSAADHWGS